MYKVIKQQLKFSKYKKLFFLLKELTHYSKNLYNKGLYIVRQEFFNTGNYKNFYDMNKDLINTIDYKLLQNHNAQWTLRMLNWNFKSFFALCKKKIKCSIPKYLPKDGYFKLCDPDKKEHINIIHNDLYWTIPLSKEILKKYNWKQIDANRPKIKIPNILKNKDIKQIWIIPKHNGNYFEIQYVYEEKNKCNIDEDKLNTKGIIKKDIKSKGIKNEKYLSIDLGIDNLCTCVDNDLKSFIIDGKIVKSWNQWYNKRISKLQQLTAKDKKAPKYTKQMYNVTKKRNNRVYDYIHRTCKYIINYCLFNDINNIILGYNKNFQFSPRLGHKINQQFINIPFGKLKDILTYLCKIYNIKLITQEESYTSKASFIDKDNLPIYKQNIKNLSFSGERIKRGLYKSKNNVLINADLNGALNIMKKFFYKESKVVTEINLYNKLNKVLYNRGVLITPKRIHLLPHKKIRFNLF